MQNWWQMQNSWKQKCEIRKPKPKSANELKWKAKSAQKLKKKTKIRQMFVLYNVWNINIHKGWKSFGHKKAAAHNNNKDKIFNKNKLGAERKSSAQIEDQQNMAKLLWHGG